MADRAKILFVDDEINILKAIKRLLRDDNYEVFTARSGEEGLKVINENNDISVVLSDYRMPGMSGVAFLEEVRKNWPQISRIMISAYGDIVSRVVGIEEGQILALLSKPCDGEELKKTIAEAVLGSGKKISEQTQEKDAPKEEAKCGGINSPEIGLPGLILEKLPMAVISFDSTKRVVQCNQKARTLLALGDKSIVDKNLNSVISAGDRIELYSALRKSGQRMNLTLNNENLTVECISLTDDTGARYSTLTLEKTQ